jgi:hypothetical protein
MWGAGGPCSPNPKTGWFHPPSESWYSQPKDGQKTQGPNVFFPNLLMSKSLSRLRTERVWGVAQGFLFSWKPGLWKGILLNHLLPWTPVYFSEHLWIYAEINQVDVAHVPLKNHSFCKSIM